MVVVVVVVVGGGGGVVVAVLPAYLVLCSIESQSTLLCACMCACSKV